MLRKLVHEVGYPALFEQLEEAGHDYSRQHVCSVIDGAEELDERFVGAAVQVLELPREKKRDLAEEFINYICVRAKRELA
jgi:hypothetical protein